MKAVLAGLMALALLVAPAQAGGQVFEAEPRPAYLTTSETGSSVQEGNLKSNCSADGTIVLRLKTCYTQDFYVFPKETISLSDGNSIIVEGADPPDSVTLRYWTRINRVDAGTMWFDRPKGKPTTVTTELEPMIDSEGLRWTANFEIDEDDVLYIAAKVRWSLGPTCLGCPQNAVWAFTAKG